ncbi:pilus assembly protein TadG-related protein [Roseibacterium sp. SDUM158017]|uniref:TadE/TadG family type IV pilus assembly protein n=1 Tax=Roseicyclus salinarum TaxID=3036773 RepID=UPI002415119E|nr:TadE/TadG family type IV pilus assembly protein [Roseibacterium sp. SDUM158017]MDG4647349.1 pilus assembly protein TadG-related protein [Roseibacterium sp. SDUM158017]
MNPAPHLARLKDDEDGSFLVIWGIGLAVFLGLIALSFDLGRVGITQTDLQSYADSTALAAAGELDGSADALDEARAAASVMVDRQTFARGDRALTEADVTLTFLSGLPADDGSGTDGFVTTDPARARFVRVDIAAHTVGLTFGAAFRALLGRPEDAVSVTASAVAGFTTLACDVSTMMMCLPPGFDANAESGRVIQLRAGGQGGGSWAPGNFGFLLPEDSLSAVDPDGACSADNFNGPVPDWCFIAAQSPATVCFEQDGVDTRTGQAVGNFAAALNTRFDIYAGVLNSYRNDPRFAPAPNVVDGIAVTRQGNGQCKLDEADPTDPAYTMPLPVDDCFFSDGGCSLARFSDERQISAAHYAEYLDVNYGLTPGTAPAWFPDWPTTLYDIYIAETGAMVNGAIPELAGRQETGGAVCNPHGRGDPERRVLIVAGIDCVGNAINGQTDDVPVDQWVRAFVVRPADTVTKDVFVEIIGSAELGSGGSGQIRDVVRLYR